MEVNIWIFDHGGSSRSGQPASNDKLAVHPVVIPVRKPTCSGEGHQDNIIRFTVPKDFTQLGEKIPGFTGCNPDTKPLCTLQVYAHSVESRQYAYGFPIIVTGHDSRLSAFDTSQIQPMAKDPAITDFGKP